MYGYSRTNRKIKSFLKQTEIFDQNRSSVLAVWTPSRVYEKV